MSTQKILLVLGAGPNIGQNLATHFSAAGYAVALVSRNGSAAHDSTTTTNTGNPASTSTAPPLHLRADLSDPSCVPAIFATVRATLGGPPTVVVYNAAALTPPTDPENLFTVPLGRLESDMAVMNTSAYVAAGQAVDGFVAADSGTNDNAPKAFIYTGAILAAVALPESRLVTLGSGKSAASYWVGAASEAFKGRGFRCV